MQHTCVVSSTWAVFSCFSIPKECRKFPPKTSESRGVKTAWIQPVGMKKVFPAVKVTRPHLSTVSPKNTSDCFPDKTQFSYNWIFRSVGGINQKICNKNAFCYDFQYSFSSVRKNIQAIAIPLTWLHYTKIMLTIVYYEFNWVSEHVCIHTI